MGHQFGIELLSLSLTDPAEAIRQLKALLEDARRNRDESVEHACADLLLALLVQRREELDFAEILARELVGKLRDATHLRLLAHIREYQGASDEAFALRKEAEHAPEVHIDATGQEILSKLFPD